MLHLHTPQAGHRVAGAHRRTGGAEALRGVVYRAGTNAVLMWLAVVLGLWLLALNGGPAQTLNLRLDPEAATPSQPAQVPGDLQRQGEKRLR